MDVTNNLFALAKWKDEVQGITTYVVGSVTLVLMQAMSQRSNDCVRREPGDEANNLYKHTCMGLC